MIQAENRPNGAVLQTPFGEGSAVIPIRVRIVVVHVHAIGIEVPNHREIPGGFPHFHTLFRSGHALSRLQRTMHEKHDVFICPSQPVIAERCDSKSIKPFYDT